MFESILIACALLIFFIVARKSREHALAIIIFALPLYLVRFSVGPFPSTLLEGMILTLFAVWVADKKGVVGAWRCISEKFRQTSRTEKALHLFLFLFVLSASISAALSPEPRAALGVWRAYAIEPALFFIVFLDTVKSPEQVRRMISASIVSGVTIALVAVYQKFTGWNIPEPWLSERRVTGAYPYPNAVGLYLAPIVWLALGRVQELFAEKKTKPSLGVIGASIVCILAIYFSKTEAALVALTTTAFGVGLLWSRRSCIATLVMSSVIIAGIVVTPSVSSTLSEKLLLRDWSGQTRLATWQETWKMLGEHPVTGAGLAGYQSVLAPYHTHDYLEIFLYPHNLILNFWSETGLYGLVSVIGVCVLLGILMTMTIRRRRGDTFVRVTTAALAAALVTILIHGLVDVPYFKNDLSVFFWFLAGSVVVLHRLSREVPRA